jgi:hypothetical protein
MPTYDSGTARATYLLDIQDVEKKAAQLKALFSGIAADAARAGTAAPGGGSAGALNQQAAAVQRAALAQQKLSTEQQKTATAANQTSLAAQRLATEEQKTAAAAARAEQAQLRLASAITKTGTAAKSGLGPTLPRSLEFFGKGALGQIAGGIGLGLGISQFASFSKEAFNAANSLEKTEATVRALSGSTARYAQVLQVAESGQKLYGGSLEENIRGLGTLVNLSNRAGVELSTLDNISRRLAVADPVQGIEGANIALKEFLSDSGAAAALSLARRFELPRHALADLAQEGTSAKDRLAGLDKLLNQQGITTQVLTDRTKTQAAVYDQLGAAALNARDRLGSLAAEALKFPAIGLTNLLNTGNVAPDTAAAGAQTQGKLIGVATSFEDYAKRVRAANDQISAAFAKDPIAGAIARQRFGLEQLNPVAFAYAQSLIQTGTAYQVAIDKARGLGDVSDSLTQQTQGQSAAFQALIPQMAQASSSSAENAGKVLALNSAYLQNQISIDVVKLALQGMIRAQDQASEAAAQEARETRNLERTFTAIVPAANAAADAINRLNNTKVLPHIADTSGNVGATGTLAGGLGGGAGDVFSGVDARQRALRDSQFQLELAQAKTNEQRIAILRRQLAQTADKVEQNRILAQIAGEQQGGKGRVSAAQSTALQLNNVEENSQLQLAKTQREGLERLRDQQDDFDLRRVRSQEDEDRKIRRLLAGGQIAAAKREREEFAIEQRRAREDFDREKRRTLRNNQEGLGDIDKRADLRQEQIGNRAALRGGKTNGGATLGSIPPPTAETGAAPAAGATGARVIQVTLPTSLVTPDGQVIANITYPFIAQRIDDDLSIELRGAALPGASQDAVAGARP